MINLFNINNYVIDTSMLGNHLHGPLVKELEDKFCKYVGAKYACAVGSATNAIFLTFENRKQSVVVPTSLPPVVPNALINGGNIVEFKDDHDWVGSSYILHNFGEYKVIDSAQRVDRNQFHQANKDDLMIFSFYPTKPVGGIDGGIIVSNNQDKIEAIRERSMNGMSSEENNWDREIMSHGWKMHMNSVQAYVALQNLAKLDDKKERLAEIRYQYNKAFGLTNTSSHLYRINIPERDRKIEILRGEGIVCGIHYRALHKMEVYQKVSRHWNLYLPHSEADSSTTLSIPFHEKLTDLEVGTVIEAVLRWQK